MKNSLFAPDGVYAKVMNWIWDVLLISVYWCLCCIPVITAGAATSAAYYAAAKCIRAGEGKVTSNFFHAFRLNLKESTLFTILYLFVFSFLVFDCVYIFNDNQIPLVVLYVFYGMIILTVVSALYLFIFNSRFTLQKFQLFRMAVLSTFRHFISTLLLLILLIAMLAGIYLMPWGILLFPGIMFYLFTYILEPVMRKHMAPPEDGEEDKWYYFNKN